MIRSIKSEPGVDTLYHIYIDRIISNDYIWYLDASTQERIGKIIRTIFVYIENPIKIILPSGVNAFKLTNNFIPDSLLESILNIGLFQTFYIIFLCSNFKSIKFWINLKSESNNITICFLPFILIIGYGLTCNILAINYIYPAFAFYNSLIESQIKKEIN